MFLPFDIQLHVHQPGFLCAEDFSTFVTGYLGGEPIAGANGEDTFACNVFLCRLAFCELQGS